MATGVRTKSKGNVTLSEQEADEEQKIDRLMALIDEGNTPGVRQFILDEQALGVNLADETGQTAVHRAINFTPESVNILNILISNGALVDVPDDNGKRPIERGIEYGDAVLRCVEILLEQKQADGTRTVQLLEKNPKTGNSLLHWAAWTGNACMMKALLETGAFAEHLEEINAQGQTAMHVAAFRSPKQVVELCVLDARREHIDSSPPSPCSRVLCRAYVRCCQAQGRGCADERSREERKASIKGDATHDGGVDGSEG